MDAAHKRKDAPEKESKNTSHSASAEPQAKKLKNEKDDNKQSALAELKDALAKGTAQDVIYWMKDGTIIQLKATDSFYVALATLVDAKIRAAPIFDEAEKKYIGFVDMLDLTAAIVELVDANDTFKKKPHPDTGAGQKKKKANDKQEGEEEDGGEDDADAQRKKRDYEEDEDDPFAEHLLLESLSVKALSDFSHTDPFISVRSNESLTKVAQLLSTYHRIGVVNEKGDFIGLVTQTGFVEYLSEEHALTLDRLDQTVGELGLPEQGVFTVPVANTTALDALREMRDRKVTGLGVVNQNGLLVDMISASDLMVWAEWEACGQPIRFRHLSTLNYPITEFLAQSRAQGHHKKVNRAAEGPLVCTKETELQEVISTMLANNIHRLFVVDEERMPVSVLTFGDIIACLTS